MVTQRLGHLSNYIYKEQEQEQSREKNPEKEGKENKREAKKTNKMEPSHSLITGR